MNKRALSPLIATVLLIAFAVALGVMIMTWTSNLPEGGAGQCTKVKLSDEGICYNGEKLSLKIRNTGEVSVSGIEIAISDEKNDFSISPRGSSIQANQVLSRDVEYIKTGESSLKIKAVVGEGDDAVTCVDPSISIRPLRNC